MSWAEILLTKLWLWFTMLDWPSTWMLSLAYVGSSNPCWTAVHLCVCTPRPACLWLPMPGYFIVLMPPHPVQVLSPHNNWFSVGICPFILLGTVFPHWVVPPKKALINLLDWISHPWFPLHRHFLWTCDTTCWSAKPILPSTLGGKVA